MLTYKDTISADDYNFLRASVGWCTFPKEQAQNGIDNTFKIVSCCDGENVISCARLLWDKGYVAWLTDVIVLPQYQGKGIGKSMVKMLIDFLRSQMKDGWKVKLSLAAAKGKEPFYEKFGLRIRPNDNFGAGMDMWL